MLLLHLPWWLRWQIVCLQFRRPGFNPWVGKILHKRKWQPTPEFLPGKSHGQRSIVRCSPRGCKESEMTEWLHFHFPAIISCQSLTVLLENKLHPRYVCIAKTPCKQGLILCEVTDIPWGSWNLFSADEWWWFYFFQKRKLVLDWIIGWNIEITINTLILYIRKHLKLS